MRKPLYAKLKIKSENREVKNMTIHDPWPSSVNILSLSFLQKSHPWMIHLPTAIPRRIANIQQPNFISENEPPGHLRRKSGSKIVWLLYLVLRGKRWNVHKFFRSVFEITVTECKRIKINEKLVSFSNLDLKYNYQRNSKYISINDQSKTFSP